MIRQCTTGNSLPNVVKDLPTMSFPSQSPVLISNAHLLALADHPGQPHKQQPPLRFDIYFFHGTTSAASQNLYIRMVLKARLIFRSSYLLSHCYFCHVIFNSQERIRR